VEIAIRYEGYIERQQKQVEQFEKLEHKRIPDQIEYDKIRGLRIEARQKLKQFRPVSVGQASRLSGVTPADISVLLIYMKNYNSGSRKPEDKEDKENSN
jgi:tRNA uridine 5-carboxymethylaminomethyl modification enzyme